MLALTINGQVVRVLAAFRGDFGAMYPGDTGSYPKVQLYLGSEDPVIKPDSLNGTLAARAPVLGYDETANQVLDDANCRWLNHAYVLEDTLQGIWAEGVEHAISIQGAEDMR